MPGRGRNEKAGEAAPDIEELDRIYTEGYKKVPEGPEELAWSELGEALIAEFYTENDPGTMAG